MAYWVVCSPPGNWPAYVHFFSSLKHAVHALDSLAAIVDALRADALAAGVVKPAVFGRSHGLTGDLTLVYGHAVIKVHHSAHVLFVAGKRGVNIVAGNRHILVMWLVHGF